MMWHGNGDQEQVVKRKENHEQGTSPVEKRVLQCDATEGGLGAALMQNQLPRAFASRALADTEQGYAQTQKKLLFVLFGMQPLHPFTFGHQVEIQSDHKRLENIMKKPLLCSLK